MHQHAACGPQWTDTQIMATSALAVHCQNAAKTDAIQFCLTKNRHGDFCIEVIGFQMQLHVS